MYGVASKSAFAITTTTTSVPVAVALLLATLSVSSLFRPVLSEADSSEAALQEFIICRQCGTDIADSYYIETHKSPSATIYSNITLFGKRGVDLQVLINPIGIQFKIVNTPKALCSGVGDWVPADSWYPGFAWKFCVCPQCSTHLGWIFEPTLTATADRANPSNKGFYAIIVDNVLSEKLVQSLMVSPDLIQS
ncbi:protein cereblon-like [Arctopsyche grandis]|uniref:protein cereblon-like n=1 Tax=Arctopsyche grandis TaxID=121162 RepID=UPI00406D8B0C